DDRHPQALRGSAEGGRARGRGYDGESEDGVREDRESRKKGKKGGGRKGTREDLEGREEDSSEDRDRNGGEEDGEEDGKEGRHSGDARQAPGGRKEGCGREEVFIHRCAQAGVRQGHAQARHYPRTRPGADPGPA